MKNHICQWPNCRKSFTRAEHLRRHALNHDQTRHGYTCDRCSVHFNRPDLLERHMMRHAKRDEEAGGPGLGVLETRKRTRRAGDGSIITRPRQNQSRFALSQSTASSISTTSDQHFLEDEQPHGAPISPPGSGMDHSLSMDETDPLLAPMMPGGPFEPYVEPIPGQFDAADGSWSSMSGDVFLDTATDFNLPFAATHNYNWLFDVASLDDAFHPLDLPLGLDMAFSDPIESIPSPIVEYHDGSSVLLHAASFVERSARPEISSDLHMDWMSGSPIFDANPPSQLPRLSDHSRQGILELIVKSPPVGSDGQPTTIDSPLLTLGAFQNYSDLFFSRFNIVYPLIHQPTFDPQTIDPVFLAAIISMGATYSTREAHQLAVGIHDSLRNQLFCHADFSTQPDLWVLQAMLLIDCFGKMRAGPKQRENAQLFHCVLIKLIRRSTCCTIRGIPRSASDDPEQAWREAMDAEQRKRLAMHCFMWDTQHAVLFSQSLCMSAFEIRSSLPCSSTVWEASSAKEWARLAFHEPDHSFLPVLKAYITPGSVSRPRDLNAFARVVVLHGLMSVSADLKRRDQTTLRSETPERVGAWTPRMSRSYELWKVDFDADCLAMKLGQTGSARRFTGMKTAAHALYRAACLALNVEVLDLQIVAGASHILGRTVTPGDQERSRQNLPQWLHNESGASVTAARHASYLLQDAVMSLHDWEQTDAFHFPWCLYLATLTCWAFHGGSEHGLNRMTTDISSIIVAMTNCSSLSELATIAGKYDPTPLVMVMAQQLATVRWAVVHDAMKVLLNLSK